MMERQDLKSFLFSDSQDTAFTPTRSLRTDLRLQMSQLLGINRSFEEVKSKNDASVTELPSAFSSALSSLLLLKDQLIQDLENNLRRLLDLNVSRREAIALYLDQLANHIPGPHTLLGGTDPAGGLRRWLEGTRTPNQEIALQTYFEEIALVTLGQALLLKAWNDRGIRTWSRSDLADLNWTLVSALKPFVPLDREGWQFTKRNLYSWYIPSATLQQEIWKRLESFRLTDEGPAFLTTLLSPVHSPRPGAVTGYDPRFYQALWKATDLCSSFGSLSGGGSSGFRQSMAFSPTLRDGSLVRTAPADLTWIGTESSLFQLIVGELAQLWWGPSSPPLWATGNGLDVHSRDQLALGLSVTKPTIVSRIAEMEACDLAFVFEERSIRSQGRSLESVRYREQVEGLSYFKKIKRANTTLGALQACVALSKLRPGGLLWWAREEPLTSQEGEDLLGFYLERAQILCEWDFSAVKHSLPSAVPPLPLHLYLMKREVSLETRGNHRPLRVTVRGQIRSHVELPLLLEEMMTPLKTKGTAPTEANSNRMSLPWQICSSLSPLAQQEWKERWPDPASHEKLDILERLKNSSSPLAQIATVVMATSFTASSPSASCREKEAGLHGFILEGRIENDRRFVRTRALKELSEVEKGAFLVYVRADSWVAPLRIYLESSTTAQWLDQHAERRGSRWVLSDQVMKWLPVPKALVQTLGAEDSRETARPLDGEWERWGAELATASSAKVVAAVLERMRSLSADDVGLTIQGSLFVRAARAMDVLRQRKLQFSQVVRGNGSVNWRKILEILPKTEPISVSIHPQIRLSGNIPLHLPIHRMEKVKAPVPGILFATEIGMTLHLSSEHPRILDMVWDQLENVQHPTWSELTRYLKLPRRPEIAEATASEILQSYGTEQQLEGSLAELLSACQLY